MEICKLIYNNVLSNCDYSDLGGERSVFERTIFVDFLRGKCTN